MYFGRNVIFQVGVDAQDGRSIDGLQVDFDIAHTRSGVPSKAVINVWNLSEATLGLLRTPDATVRVLASVSPQPPLAIFTGSVIEAIPRRQGAVRVTRIEAEDGGKTIREVRVAVNISTPTTAQEVLAEVLKQMGIPQGTVRTDLTTEFSAGFSYQGPARDVLRMLADSTASDWTVRDGALLFIPRNGATSEAALLFSSRTRNLIGEPATTQDGGVELTALLAPQMRPGQRFQLESRALNGTYVADRVDFQGGTHIAPFLVKVTGRPA